MKTFTELFMHPDPTLNSDKDSENISNNKPLSYEELVAMAKDGDTRPLSIEYLEDEELSFIGTADEAVSALNDMALSQKRTANDLEDAIQVIVASQDSDEDGVDNSDNEESDVEPEMNNVEPTDEEGQEKMESVRSIKSFGELVKEAARPEEMEEENQEEYSDDEENDDSDLKSKMVASAKECCPEADDMDIEAAIYWLANDYHEGQNSELYSILSTSEYNPGRMENNVDDAGEIARMIYDELETAFVSQSAENNPIEEPEIKAAPEGEDSDTFPMESIVNSKYSFKRFVLKEEEGAAAVTADDMGKEADDAGHGSADPSFIPTDYAYLDTAFVLLLLGKYRDVKDSLINFKSELYKVLIQWFKKRTLLGKYKLIQDAQAFLSKNKNIFSELKKKIVEKYK